MNIIKLFALASICFSATSINAMHHQRNVQVKTVDINNLNLFSFDNIPDDDLSHFYKEHLIISAYSEIIDLKLTHIERKKIYQMMQRNIDKIIENLLNIV